MRRPRTGKGRLNPDADTDRAVLWNEAYASSRNLDARIGLYAFSTGAVDLVDHVLSAVDWRAGWSVLDVGCGTGRYLAALERRERRLGLVGVDLSSGMAAEARSAAPSAKMLVGDVASLPFVDSSFDVVMANHMLYHVPDLPAAVAEVRRVLAPGGTLLATTNGDGHLRELRAAAAEAAGVDTWPLFAAGFSLETGAVELEQLFDAVTIERIGGKLVVPSTDPLLRYLESTRDLTGSRLPEAHSWEVAMVALDEAISRRIEGEGSFGITTDTGYFVCR